MIYYLVFLSFCFSASNAYENSWMVSIQGNPNNTYNRHFCAGVFIRNEYILTSAHCLYERLNDTVFTLHTQVGTPDHQSYPINPNFIKIHPDWFGAPSHLLGDIALIKVPSLRQNAKLLELELPSKSYYPNGNNTQCLKITEKVSFNSSETSYVYILTKFIKSAKNYLIWWVLKN